MVRFGIVGVVVNLVFYGVYLAMLELQVAPLWAMSIVYACAVMLSFLLHGHWTFGEQVQRRRFGPFCVVYLAGYVLNGFGLWLMIGGGVSPQFAQAIMVFVVAAISLVLQKFWVFRVPAPESRNTR